MSELDTSPTKLKLDNAIKELNCRALPERNLWTGIEHAIAEEEQSRPSLTKVRPFYAIAASAVVLGFVAMMSFYSGKNLSGQALVEQLSAQHLQQKQSLLVSLQGQVTLTENWQQQLQELDEAAEAIKKALANEPNNMALLQMLKNVHQQQIALIERVHAPAWQQI